MFTRNYLLSIDRYGLFNFTPAEEKNSKTRKPVIWIILIKFAPQKTIETWDKLN